MSAARSKVLSGYRRLFRARKNLFLGDERAMNESRVAIKGEFVKNQSAATSGPHFEGLMTMIDEAEDMLVNHIVRGDLNPQTGNYQVKIEPHHTRGAEQHFVEPITQSTVKKMEKHESIEVTKSCSNSKN